MNKDLSVFITKKTKASPVNHTVSASCKKKNTKKTIITEQKDFRTKITGAGIFKAPELLRAPRAFRN